MVHEFLGLLTQQHTHIRQNNTFRYDYVVRPFFHLYKEKREKQPDYAKLGMYQQGHAGYGEFSCKLEVHTLTNPTVLWLAGGEI